MCYLVRLGSALNGWDNVVGTGLALTRASRAHTHKEVPYLSRGAAAYCARRAGYYASGKLAISLDNHPSSGKRASHMVMYGQRLNRAISTGYILGTASALYREPPQVFVIACGVATCRHTLTPRTARFTLGLPHIGVTFDV